MSRNASIRSNNVLITLFVIVLSLCHCVDAFFPSANLHMKGLSLNSNINCRHFFGNQPSCLNPLVSHNSLTVRVRHVVSKAKRIRMSNDNDTISPSSINRIVTISSALSLVSIDILFRKLLKSLSVSFPSPLAGCAALFSILLAIGVVKEEWGNYLYGLLAPGAALLAKWLPVFFVPSLVTLPLAQSLGSSVEIIKVAIVIISGFFFTLLTTAYSVVGIRNLRSEGNSTMSEVLPRESKDIESSKSPEKAFSDSTFQFLFMSTILGGVASIIASRSNVSLIKTPLQSMFMLFMTLSTFVFGARLPKSFIKYVHPLVTCTSLTWLGAKFMGILTGKSFISMLRSYKAGSLCPLHFGAGDVLLFMLGPAVVALACQMYDRKKLMKENISEVGAAVTVSSIGGLFGTAAMVRVLGIRNQVLRLSMLSRNITSPLAMAIASILGADASLAVSITVVTGLIGANFGASILDAVGIKDAVARGLSIGAAAHGLGTASFSNEKDAFPFAAIGMALTASFCTVLVSVPTIKSWSVKTALGL